MRPLFLVALCLAASPALAQEPTGPVARALAEIEAHRVGMRVGCSIPVPALWNAPPWEQRAAADRRAAFEDCLSGVMQREQDRLAQLQERIAALHSEAPGADWSAADQRFALLDKDRDGRLARAELPPLPQPRSRRPGRDSPNPFVRPLGNSQR